MSCDSKDQCWEEPHLCSWPNCKSAEAREAERKHAAQPSVIQAFKRRFRMTPTNRRRLWGMPLRIVVLLPFYLRHRLGQLAEHAGSAIEPYLPKGFEG